MRVYLLILRVDSASVWDATNWLTEAMICCNQYPIIIKSDLRQETDLQRNTNIYKVAVA